MLFDSSWSGLGGIGRFSDELSSRLSLKKICLTDKPASPLATIFISISLFFEGKSDVVFLPGYIPPLFTKKSYIFTIHDLNHLDRPENTSFAKKIFYKCIIKRGIKNASFVLTVSEFSRKRIISWCGVEQERVINVGNGVELDFNDFVMPFRPGYDYFLCVSNRKQHKNEPALILAFANANIDNSIKLILTGSESAHLRDIIVALGVSERIVFLGTVPDSDLPGLYKGSQGLLFPSLYEGFGLPVVEAMACGVPVLASNTTSLPEVAGDAALLINPESVDEIRIGIERLAKDKLLRADLIAKGLERAKLFSWDVVAERVQAVLNEVVNKHEK